MKEVIWAEPTPPTARGGVGGRVGRIKYLDAELRANPGKWALLAEGRKQVTINKHFYANGYERAYRTVTEAGVKLFRAYVRYVGNTSPDA